MGEASKIFFHYWQILSDLQLDSIHVLRRISQEQCCQYRSQWMKNLEKSVLCYSKNKMNTGKNYQDKGLIIKLSTISTAIFSRIFLV